MSAVLSGLDRKFGRGFFIAACAAIWFLIISLIFKNDWHQVWGAWGFPPFSPPFIDLMALIWGAETFKAGLDPSVVNPNDPLGRLFNYPKIWYLIFYTGISQEHVVWIGVILIALFFLVLFLFPVEMRIRDAICLLLIVFSSSSALLYERGNIDLIAFILCGLAILLMNARPVYALGILLFAALLKFFPIFGLGAFLKESRNRFFGFIGGGLIFMLGYLLFNFASFRSAWQTTPQSLFLSFGANIIFDLFAAAFNAPAIAFRLVSYGCAFFFGGMVFKRGIRRGDEAAGKNLTAFRLGAAIFIGTFLIGHNWDYRLAFLIFVVPQLSSWMFDPAAGVRNAAFGAFAALVISCWQSFILAFLISAFGLGVEIPYYLLDEMINWMLCFLIVYLLAASAPAWVKRLEFNPFASERASL